MSTPVNGAAPVQPLFDSGQGQIAEVPAQLAAQVINTSAGQRLALTLRIPNGTVSVLLAKDDAQNWADLIRTRTGEMSGLILPGG